MGLHLLFASGKRPARAAIREFAAATRSVSVSHDPDNDAPLHLVATNGEFVPPGKGGQPDSGEQTWVELLREGLTFDLIGLAPGQSGPIPDVDHRFDLDQSPAALRLEAVTLIPGQHLAGGAHTLPVMRGLCGLARDLIHHFESVEAVVWSPAASAIGRRYFESVITAWLEGGAFPALGLTSFRETMDGSLQSVGLAYWIGQELRIEPPLTSDKVAATRLGVRLINQLIAMGGIEASERLIAPDGSRLVMRPSRNRRFIRVSPE